MILFFDLDGTLLDSNGLWEQIDLDFLSARGLTPTPEFTRAVSHSIFPVAAQFTVDHYHLPETPEEIMAEWLSMAEHAYRSTLPLKPGARELLDRALQEGHRLALLTACVPELAKAALAHHGIEQHFTSLFFAQEVGMEKRDQRVYPLAAQQLGAPLSQCVLFEDAPDNCKAAKAAGLRVVGVYDSLYHHRWPEVMANSHRAVRDLRELLPQQPLPF